MKIKKNVKIKVKTRVSKCNTSKLSASKLKDEFEPTLPMIKAIESIAIEGFPKSWSALAKKAGVTRKTIWLWRLNEKFREWFEKKLDENFNNAKAIIKQKVIDKAFAGDFNSIRLYLEITGVYNPKAEFNIADIPLSINCTIDKLNQIKIEESGKNI